MGILKYFLGLEVVRSGAGILINHRKYALDVLVDAGKLGAKLSKTSMGQNFKLSKDEGKPLEEPSIHRRFVGRLLYLTITKPDIACSVQSLSQFMQSPSGTQLKAIYKVLQHIKQAPGLGLLFPPDNELNLRVFYDSNWGSYLDTRRSIMSSCIFLGKSLLS